MEQGIPEDLSALVALTGGRKDDQQRESEGINEFFKMSKERRHFLRGHLEKLVMQYASSIRPTKKSGPPIPVTTPEDAQRVMFLHATYQYYLDVLTAADIMADYPDLATRRYPEHMYVSGDIRLLPLGANPRQAVEHYQNQAALKFDQIREAQEEGNWRPLKRDWMRKIEKPEPLKSRRTGLIGSIEEKWLAVARRDWLNVRMWNFDNNFYDLPYAARTINLIPDRTEPVSYRPDFRLK
ncbi:hypothetical protein HYZ05_01800 [Candidatus Daviesbacteria bacterium]|nr:hypothetical protein [Candidatus Daviesbacteria bacterium]